MNRAQEVLGELNRALLQHEQQQQQRQQHQHQQGDGDEPDNVEDDQELDEELDDDIDRDADGTLDGGVAGAPPVADDNSTAPRRRAADCDLLLYITCAENMDDIAPLHPILKEGVCVSIGLDKNTKLGAVFSRYAEFCNEHSKTKIEESDLEFFHCQLLNGKDTAEASALMKNDKIKVRRERAAERETAQELKRIQRESDREYFKQLRHLLPDLGGSKFCDVIFDCRGKIADGSGRNQQVLSTAVRGNSVLLSRRCKWLDEMIQRTREERAKQQSVMTIPSPNEVKSDDDGEGKSDDDDDDRSQNNQSCVSVQEEGKNIVANNSSSSPLDDHDRRVLRAASREDIDIEEEDDDILGYPVPRDRPQREIPQRDVERGGAAEIENDDEDNDNDDRDSNDEKDDNRRPHGGSRSPVISSASNLRSNSNVLWVTVANHSPEAVKLLLEYCYTNRVIPLGQEAFVQACKTKPVNSKDGPVSPYSGSRRWPNSGLPQVSFSVALAGIALAEEAGMHRLSLMCEIAASNLLSSSNVVEALLMCTRQESHTGNALSRLREVAVNVVLRSGPLGAHGGVYDMPLFRRALEERTTSIIPTLLKGTVEAMSKSHVKNWDEKIDGAKRPFSAIAGSYFDEVDREDAYRRERERRCRRLERWEKNPELAAKHGAYHDADTAEVYCDPVLSTTWAAESARRSLKRMSQHLGGGIIGRVGMAPSRDAVSQGFARFATARMHTRRSSEN